MHVFRCGDRQSQKSQLFKLKQQILFNAICHLAQFCYYILLLYFGEGEGGCFPHYCAASICFDIAKLTTISFTPTHIHITIFSKKKKVVSRSLTFNGLLIVLYLLQTFKYVCNLSLSHLKFLTPKTWFVICVGRAKMWKVEKERGELKEIGNTYKGNLMHNPVMSKFCPAWMEGLLNLWNAEENMHTTSVLNRWI